MEECKGNINSYCYCCGHFISLLEKHTEHVNYRAPSEQFKLLYEVYFDQQLISGVPWVPKWICGLCYKTMLAWRSSNGKTQMKFGVPMIWTQPNRENIHDKNNCYACANHFDIHLLRNMKKYNYKAVRCAQLPLPHDENIPFKFPSPPGGATIPLSAVSTPSTVVTTTETLSEQMEDPLYLPGSTELREPVPLTQDRMDYIVAKLGLSQRNSEELARFLKMYHLLAPETKVTGYRSRQSDLQAFFTVNEEKTYAYCDNVSTLMIAMDIEYDPKEWRLFIDASKASLKAVILHRSNKKPAIPLAYSTETKESHDVLKKNLSDIQYEEHNWKLCCDLKVVAMLCGLQSGYTKHMCFLCDWNSRYMDRTSYSHQYDKKDWEMRKEHRIGTKNVLENALVEKEKILLPPLHIKLGIVKNYIKTIYKDPNVAKCLKEEVFKGLSEEKLKNGMY